MRGRMLFALSGVDPGRGPCYLERIVTRRRYNHLMQALEAAREALASGRERRVDPWRLEELKLAYDRAQTAALDAEFEPDESLPPAARRPLKP